MASTQRKVKPFVGKEEVASRTPGRMMRSLAAIAGPISDCGVEPSTVELQLIVTPNVEQFLKSVKVTSDWRIMMESIVYLDALANIPHVPNLTMSLLSRPNEEERLRLDVTLLLFSIYERLVSPAPFLQNVLPCCRDHCCEPC